VVVDLGRGRTAEGRAVWLHPPDAQYRETEARLEIDGLEGWDHRPRFPLCQVFFGEALAWHRQTERLAEWTLQRLANRFDSYGGYYRSRDGTVKQTSRKSELSHSTLVRHFRARDPSDIVGLYTTSWHPSGCLSRWGSTDLDCHDQTGSPETNWRAALAWHERLINLGFHPILLDSNGVGGYRNFVVFSEPTPTLQVFQFFQWLIRDWQELGLSSKPETFPKQPRIGPPGSGHREFGNWMRLPGRHHRRPHWSRVWHNEQWHSGDAAIDLLLATTGDDPSLIPIEALTVEPPARRTHTPLATRQHEHSDDRTDDHTGDIAGNRHVSPPAGLVRRAERALRYLGAGAKDESGHEYVSDYDLWLKVGIALHELGPAGLDLWIKWSRKCPEKFDEEVCRQKWNTFRHGSGVNLGWLYRQAKRRGWK
jgi:hypothetical protein